MLEKVIAKESTRTTASNDGLYLSLIRVPSQSRDINTKVLFTHLRLSWIYQRRFTKYFRT